MVLALASCARAAPFREVLSISQSRMVSALSVSATRCRSRRKGRIPVLSSAAVCPEVRVWPFCACSTSLAASFTVSPTTSRSHRTIGPLWNPTRKPGSAPATAGRASMHWCILAAALAAASGVAKSTITSSPMSLTTRPPADSAAVRNCSMQCEMAVPLTSANRTVAFMRLGAGKLHLVRASIAHVAEADPAVPAQREVFSLEQDRLLVVDRDVGAVGAVVLHHELPAAQLDRAVLARSRAVGHHQAAAILAPDHDRRMLARAFDRLVAVSQPHDRGRGCLRHDLAQPDAVALLPHRQLAQLARVGLERRAEQRRGLLRGNGLALLRLLDQLGGELHRVAKHVLLDLDYRPAVEADVHAELGVADRGQRVDGGVHLRR